MPTTGLPVEWADGRRDAILFAIEEESDDRKFSIHRLAQHRLDLAVMFDTDRVVPVTIFPRRRYQTFDHLSCAPPQDLSP